MQQTLSPIVWLAAYALLRERLTHGAADGHDGPVLTHELFISCR
jgi:hypothetical protein